MKPLVIVTEHLEPAAADWLKDRTELVFCQADDPRFETLLPRAQALVIRTYTKITPALLAKAPNLRVVGRAGVGLDNVDVHACNARNVKVVSTPDANTRAVVEYIFALLLDATRPRAMLDKALDMPAWKTARQELNAKRQLCQMTLGIWGMGKIGTQVARAAQGFDMPVIYHDLLEIPEHKRFGAAPVSLDTLWRQADIITIHVDGRRSNRAIVSAPLFARAKPNLIFINAARGFVVDNFALAEFMTTHKAATALLDVHEPEPFPASYPLLDIANVHLLPHIASATSLANSNMSLVVKDVAAVLQGHQPAWETTAADLDALENQ